MSLCRVVPKGGGGGRRGTMHLENIIPIDLGEEINPHHQSLDVLTPNECVPPKLVPTSLPHLTPRRGGT